LDRTGRFIRYQRTRRTRQIELAEQFGITDYPSRLEDAANGAEFCAPIKEVIGKNKAPGQDELEILKVGRHFVVGIDKLLVVGRNQSEIEN